MNELKPISQISVVFPESILLEIHEYMKTIPLRYGWTSNRDITPFSHWNSDYTFLPRHAGAGQENGLDVSAHLAEPMAKAWQYLQDQFFGEQTLIRCYSNVHTHGVEGYPHVDSVRTCDYTAVIYMTPHWKREWGGETVIYDGDKIIHSEIPKLNSSLIFNGAQVHCARGITRICPVERRTLMFKFAKPGADLFRDRIQLALLDMNVDKVPHGNKVKNTLFYHLLLTYDRLKHWGYSEVVCGGGAFHSIFGTNIFKDSVLKSEDRGRVVDIIGEEATVLVELFRDIERPNTLEDALKNKETIVKTRDGRTMELSTEQFNNLCKIEAANLFLQGGFNHHQYENLSKFIVNHYG
jgi:SM-20-related protein